jgi:hypothetical protein
MKLFTDLSQSKALAKILPLESADMFHFIHGDNNSETVGFGYKKEVAEFYSKTKLEYIPCWSLAALLDVIRKTIGYTIYGIKNVYISCELGNFKRIETDLYDNEVDACMAMIEKLNELKLL